MQQHRAPGRLDSAVNGASFAERVLSWFDLAGRHDLPWQLARTPYRVWLSEIMLQQTQVQTVIPYFERFVARFPDVAALAAAEVDEVLHLWSGLGYYSRARNLLRTARVIVDDFGGRFPDSVETLARLPGIGRSTAAAIVALSWDRPAAILDGNVKRVLARYYAVAGWPGDRRVADRLWACAEEQLPHVRARDYTQALMDLGATLCTRSRPRCDCCPLVSDCAAYRSEAVADYPSPKPRREVPLRETGFLIVTNAAREILLERRPPAGIWGGLWCFPELRAGEVLEPRLRALGLSAWREGERLAEITHAFTHFRLRIAPLRIHLVEMAPSVHEGDALRWYSPGDSTRIGLPAPVSRLLTSL